MPGLIRSNIASVTGHGRGNSTGDATQCRDGMRGGIGVNRLPVSQSAENHLAGVEAVDAPE
jgi:hypothetical protein